MVKAHSKYTQRFCLLITVGLLSCHHAWALFPHQVAVIANQDSIESLTVANHFLHNRDIPQKNLILVSSPRDEEGNVKITIDQTAFSESFWEPVTQALKKKRIKKQIRAWVLSTDLPTTVLTQPPSSIHGLIFAKNQAPPGENIKRGTYLSPLYAGPDEAKGAELPSASLNHFYAQLRDNTPFLAMSLGYTGIRGNTYEEVLQTLANGKAADFTKPEVPIYFINNKGIRSSCRDWQFPIMKERLRGKKQLVFNTKAWPDKKTKLIGLQMGLAKIDMQRFSFVPGAVAEHLTSFGAHFETEEQSKCSGWISAGATATAGTVTEPFALWPKFPHARFFEHYIKGASIIESFYLSLRSPMQIYLLGEPLARPFATEMDLRIHIEMTETAARISTKAMGTEKGEITYNLFLDGKFFGANESGALRLPRSILNRGCYTIGILATGKKDITPYAWKTEALCTETAAEISLDLEKADSENAHFKLAGIEKIAGAQISRGGQKLGTVDEQGACIIPINKLGRGPVILQVETKTLRSKPFLFKIP